jgi:hypothetical protein
MSGSFYPIMILQISVWRTVFTIFEILRKEVLGVISPRGKFCIDIFPTTHYFGAAVWDGQTD